MRQHEMVLPAFKWLTFAGFCLGLVGESFIFCFAIGGIGAVLYNALTNRYFVRVSAQEQRGRMHRFHVAALLVPYVLFVALYFLPWNPIYPAILCLVTEGRCFGLLMAGKGRKSERPRGPLLASFVRRA